MERDRRLRHLDPIVRHIADADLFGALDLERPALAGVRAAVDCGDYPAAYAAWGHYFRARPERVLFVALDPGWPNWLPYAAVPVPPAELRRRVTSPKGTTERAIAVLEEAHLAEVFDRATDAALARARELAAGA